MIRNTYPYRIFDWLILVFAILLFSACIAVIFYTNHALNSWKLFGIFIPNLTLSTLTILHFINKKSRHFYKSFLIPFSCINFMFIQNWLFTFYAFGHSPSDMQGMIKELFFLSIFVIINLTGFIKNKSDFPKVIFQYIIIHQIFNFIGCIPFLFTSYREVMLDQQESIMKMSYDVVFYLGYISISLLALKEKILPYRAFSLLIFLLLIKRALRSILIEYFNIYL